MRFCASAFASGRRIDVVVKEGTSAKEIVRQAEELPAALLILGTHRGGGFERLVLGPVTEKIIRTTRRPVLTGPLPAEPHFWAATVQVCLVFTAEAQNLPPCIRLRARGNRGLLAEACLGLRIEACSRRVSFVRGALPEAVDWLTLSNVRVAGASVDVRIDRHAHHLGVTVWPQDGDAEIVVMNDVHPRESCTCCDAHIDRRAGSHSNSQPPKAEGRQR
jgi:universal stress protein family protein